MLVDAHALIFQVFHAIREPMTGPDGRPTNALFGFTRVLWVAVALLALAGAADMVSAIFRNTILQVATPDALRGRLQGVFIVGVTGGPRFAYQDAYVFPSGDGWLLPHAPWVQFLLIALAAAAIVRACHERGGGFGAVVTGTATFVCRITAVATIPK